MRFGSIISLSVLLLATAGCQGTFGEMEHRDGDFNDDGIGEIPTPACPVDPDCAITDTCSLYECPTYWECEYLADGTRKRCTNPGPDFPDNSGSWDCRDEGGETICTGSDYPTGDGSGGWNCERRGEFVECSRPNPDYPDGGADGPWNCWYTSEEWRVCENGGPGAGGGWTCYDTPTGRQCRNRNPEYPDGRDWNCYDFTRPDGTVVTRCEAPGDMPADGGGGAWDCESQGDLIVCEDDTPAFPSDGGTWGGPCIYEDGSRICDEAGYPPGGPPGGPGGGDTLCVSAQQRWCDDDRYCSWGKQTCRPDGTWGPCIEPTVVAGVGLTDKPATECGCRYFYFNADCCEDQLDRDEDGVADCIIPRGHTPPTCATDGSLCSFCDDHADCGGGADLCLFRRDGYALCASRCETEADCPGGYTCTPIMTRGGATRQCAPTAGICG